MNAITSMLNRISRVVSGASKTILWVDLGVYTGLYLPDGVILIVDSSRVTFYHPVNIVIKSISLQSLNNIPVGRKFTSPSGWHCYVCAAYWTLYFIVSGSLNELS